MVRGFVKSIKVTIAFLFIVGVYLVFFQVFSPTLGQSRDAIAMRVVANPEHFSALRWYNENVSLQGSPQLLTVDGYPGVRDGRTVYVGAANVDVLSSSFYTNIYIISFNQDAERATEDIFGEILSNWRFNINLENVALSGNCTLNTAVSCLTDAECSDLGYCTSFKAKTTRDTVRLARMNDIDRIVQGYNQTNGSYPILAAGTYIPHASISVWPSWQETFGQSLGSSLPIDPINDLSGCAGFNSQTCWDEGSQTFAWTSDLNAGIIPANNFVIMYRTDNVGADYVLCTYSETGFITGSEACNGACVPICLGKECGPDSCGGNCPPGCSGAETCVGGSCFLGCISAPDCQAALVNAHAVAGYCSSGSCYECDFGYTWDGSSCSSACIPDGCNGTCPFACTSADDADCFGSGCCGDSNCDVGESSTSCLIDCPVLCNDLDGDEYGNPGSAYCTYAELDCNDSDFNINPGITEICSDGVDNNCNGAIDCFDPDCIVSIFCIPATCGAGGCESGEDCFNCPSDCGVCPATCPDGFCDISCAECSSCSADCTDDPICCGDGICQTWETPGTCPSDCTGGCGDGFITAPEICDDGNTVDGDGCNSNCATELNYTCTGAPSICVADTQTVSCEPVALPANAVWNPSSTVLQTWDGSTWVPSNIRIYDTNPGPCRFMCDTGYTWDGSSCILAVCVFDTDVFDSCVFGL